MKITKNIKKERIIVPTLKSKNYFIGITVILLCLFFTNAQANAAEWKLNKKLLASDGAKGDHFGHFDAVSISGDIAIVGAHFDDDKGKDSGSAYIFRRTGNTWAQEQKILASDGAANDELGESVSISGDTAIMGARYDDDKGMDSGSAYIFRRIGNTWTQEQKLLANDGAPFDCFGTSVSISGDKAIVGACSEYERGTNLGSAYIFRRTGSTWVQEQKLLPGYYDGYDAFGESVSISGDTAIVGAFSDSGKEKDSGSAYIFRLIGKMWGQEQKLLASDGAEADFFGISVFISGNTVIVGACYDDSDKGANSGSAYIFRRTGNTWAQEQKILASDGAAGDVFGESVSISGDTVIVGACSNNTEGIELGSAYIFRRTGNTWAQEQKLLASDGTANDKFGESVSISGDIAIVGAYFDDDKGIESGSAYIFEYSTDEFSTAPVIGEVHRISDNRIYLQQYLAAGYGRHLEIAVGTNDGKVYLYDNKGQVLPGWPQLTNGSPIINRPAIADINRDGGGEVIACAGNEVYAWDIKGILLSGFPYIVKEKGKLWPSPQIFSGPIIGDIDKDGALDAIIVYNEGNFVDGGNWYVKVFNLYSKTELWSKSFSISRTAQISSPAIGDLNADGMPEVVVGENSYYDGIRIHAWDYKGNYINSNFPAKYANRRSDARVSDPVLGDLDGDGDLEIIFGYINAEGSGTSGSYVKERFVYAIHHDSTILKGWPKEFAKKDIGFMTSLGDLNNDGTLEVIVYDDVMRRINGYFAHDPSTGEIHAFYGNGQKLPGNWPILTAQVGKDPGTIPSIADINNDSMSDVMSGDKGTMMNAWDNKASVLNLWPRAISGLMHDVSIPTLGDLDSDGKLDIVIAKKDLELQILHEPVKVNKLEWPQYRHDPYNTNCYPQDPKFINKPPYFYNVSSYQRVNENDVLNFDVTAYDDNNDYIDINALYLPKGATFRKTGLGTINKPGMRLTKFSWKPDWDMGTKQYSIVFNASDGRYPIPTTMNTIIEVMDKQKSANLSIGTYQPLYEGWSQLSGVAIFIKEVNKTLTTDFRGQATFKDLNPGTYTVKASKTNYQSQTQTVTLKELENKGLSFYLKPIIKNPGYLQGKITKKGTNTPLSGVTVWGSRINNHKTTTNANGNYSINLPAGSNKIEVYKVGYKYKSVTITIQKGKYHTLNIELEKI